MFMYIYVYMQLSLVSTYMKKFIDERDRGSLIVTHTYLLLGLALPLFLDAQVCCEESEEKLHGVWAGVLAVGVGDAVASIIGRR